VQEVGYCGRDGLSSAPPGQLAHVAERSGRAQDQDDGGGLETLRRGGYM
jgi:sulfate adenylyltransferase subunit 2